MPKPNSWFDIKNFDKGNYTEIFIYDEIAEWGVSAKDFIIEINKIITDTVNIRINSVGGSIFDGFAIYNAIKRLNKRVDTYIDGVAASAASVIALAGDKVHMAENSWLMIHNPWTMAMGDANDFRHVASTLDSIKSNLVNIYSSKTGIDSEQISAMLDNETWFTGQEALDAKFVDELTESVEVQNRLDLSKFKNTPDSAKSAYCVKFGACQPKAKAGAGAEAILDPAPEENAEPIEKETLSAVSSEEQAKASLIDKLKLKIEIKSK